MKTLPVLCLLLSCLSASAWAQQTPPCPTLPDSAGLQWEQRVDRSFIACKAVTADGRQVLNVMLTARDPKISLERSLRAEEGNFSGRGMYWYRPDLGGREIPGMESRRITVVKLGKDQYAQVWIDAESPTELASLRALAQQLDVSATSATLLSAGR
ncbi:hypothetical protein [Pseudoxanthomonas putridarboris]|uniref:Secreted protein n=1 Tax=Pseudoxanthomonas putridarboris TaxID=752605 RepID=A0ABU9J236_9GAMM